MLNKLLVRNPDTEASQLYVEDIFSTYLYTGTGASKTINNGVNLSANGGMVWIKSRSANTNHIVYDTTRGVGTAGNNANALFLNDNAAITSGGGGTSGLDYVSAFTTTGFTVTNGGGFTQGLTALNATYASWTFRKAAKFFDIVTYTGNGANRTIAHGLGVAPGMILVKRTNSASPWSVYHRSLANTDYLVFNTMASSATATTRWNSTTATSSTFGLGTDTAVNASGGSYVAYLFAHDTDASGMIECGSFSTNATGAASVDVGWEPQFLIVKATNTTDTDWMVFDNMRGLISGTADAQLVTTTAPETFTTNSVEPTASGFKSVGLNASTTFIYMAVRRGPMRVPTDGTTVFQPLTRTGTGTASTVTTSITPDLVINKIRGSAAAAAVMDRMRDNAYLFTTSTAGDTSSTTISPAQMFDNQFGFDVTGTNLSFNSASGSYISYIFRRAPSFFDTVCYTGTGSATAITHNLGVAPELMLIKARAGATTAFNVYAGSNTSAMILNSTAIPATSSTYWNNTSPTSTQFTVGTGTGVNTSGATYVAYLFASCPGVSKVGTYTGNGTSLDVNCGFTNGARFVLIKRIDSTGNWYVFDSARGIVAANDPYFFLDTTAAEGTANDLIDPYSAGFNVPNGFTNTASATYFYFAIA